MEFKAFAEEIRKQVQSELGENVTVELREVLKVNNLHKCGLTIMEKGRNISPTLYLEDHYRAYQQGKTIEAIANAVIEGYRELTLHENIEVSFFKNFEEVKGRIVYRLLELDKNRELLSKIPFLPYLDLAICFYCVMGETPVGEGAILVHNTHMALWKTNVRELFSLAEENTMRRYPPEFMPMEELLENLLGAPETDMVWGEALPRMYVLTNGKRLHGAAVMLYPGLLENLAERLDGSFYIIPSSVHELIIVPYQEEILQKTLKSIIYEVNHTQLAQEEILSDNLYAYDRKNKRIIKL